MSDIGTVVWKEWREHFLRRGKPSRAVWSSLFLVVFVGIIGPVAMNAIMGNFGRYAPSQESFVSLMATYGVFAMAFQGIVVSGALIIDMLAGERERHTLETLLAGPLPDSAILVGKILAIALFCFLSALLLGLTEQATLLILVGVPAFGYAGAVVAGPLLAIAFAGLVCAAGAMVGMRAATVKSGQQVLQFILMPLYMLPGFLQPVLQFTPFGRSIIQFYDDAGPAIFLVMLIAAVVVLDVLLLAIAHKVFRRDRLLLVRR